MIAGVESWIKSNAMTVPEGVLMSDLPGLLKRGEQRAFADWDDFVPRELAAKSDEAIRQLIGRLAALGSEPTREQVQEEIDWCVQRFNELDNSSPNSWICTIEREDICEVLGELLDLCGYDGSEEEWLRDRTW
jgi:hypothetical protein